MIDRKTILRDAAGLAALPADHPDRVAAYALAREDAACRAALAQGERLLALVDALPAPTPPDEAVLQRIEAQVLGEMQREAAAAPSGRLVWYWAPLTLLVGTGLLLMLVAGKLTHLGQWPHTAAVVAAAVGLAAVALHWGRLAMYGAIAVSAALSLFAGSMAATGAVPIRGCLVAEGSAALLPLAAVIWLLWRRRAKGDPWSLGAVAAAGALAGQAVLHLACPSRDVTHLLAAHTGGVVVAAFVGLVLSMTPALRRLAR